MKNIFIKNREIGSGNPPYIIAEISGNHNGDIKKALELIEKAHEAGVDAVKIQTYTAETITLKHKSEDFKIKGGLWDGKYLYDLYDEAHTPWEWHEELFKKANTLGLHIFSSPFDHTAVDFLEDLNVPAYKIASFELLDLPLVEYVASKKKPMILSTGMANKKEIHDAVQTAQNAGASQIALLHCVSGYPTPIKETNLSTISELKNMFKVPIGLSDHTLGTVVPVAAVSLGASIIEKHFILDREDKGPDSDFSLEPQELKKLVENSKLAWSAIGEINFEIKPSEKQNLKFRRSLYAVEDIKKGEMLTNNNIRSIRPGYGMHPKLIHSVIGKLSNREIKKGTAMKLEYIEK